MWWLAIVGGLFFFRGKIAEKLGPFLPDLSDKERAPKIAFYGHLLTVVAAVIYVLPLELLGLGMIKSPAYLASLWSAVLTLVFALKVNYGAPPVPQNISLSNWKESMSRASTTLEPWLRQVMSGVDFHFLFFATIFLTAYPSVWALSILVRRSLWSVGTYCTKNTPQNRLWLMFTPTWEKLKAREKEVLQYAALAEVLLAFWLTVSLALPSRQILACILYWNYLKTRYQMPRSHELHAQAWSKLGQQVEPVLKAVPILRKPVDMAKGWFAPQMQQR